jgi:hypothetical protein
MNFKFLLALLPLLVFFTGCGENAPAKPPVATAKHVPPKKPPAKDNATPSAPVNANKHAPGTGTATYGIDNTPGNFNDQPMPQTLRVQPLPPLSSVQAPQSPAAGAAPAISQPPAAANIPSPASIPSPAPEASALPPQPAPQPTMTPIVLEDASLPAGTSPAVVALLGESDRSRKSGDLDSAVVVMERALRIDARNPTLTYKLAQLRLKQSKPQQAEELARKAALLAGNDQELKRKSWLLIAHARQMQQDISGAKEAKAKAQSFYGH